MSILKEENFEIVCATEVIDRLLSKKANLTVARLTVNVLSPILRPLREAQAMSVTAGS